MAINHLESLVLRAVSVLRDGVAVSLRLGSYEAKAQTSKATPFAMRHPSPGCAAIGPHTRGRTFPTANANGNGAVLWAGRLSRAGVLGRRSPAASAGWASAERWSATVGGPRITAAVRLCLPWAKQAAPVADASFRRPSTLHDFAFQRTERGERERQATPAGMTGTATRTPPAVSTRGNGGR
jgi:hypothetical protein